jgi:hypothetical protein
MPVNFALTPDQLNGFQADQWAQKANTAVADAWQAQQVANLQPMPVPPPPALTAPTPSDSLTQPMQAAPQPAPLVGTVPEGTPSTDASVPPPVATSAPSPVTAPLVFPSAPPPTQQPIAPAPPPSPDETISNPFGEAFRQLQGITQPQASAPPPSPIPTWSAPTGSDTLTNPIQTQANQATGGDLESIVRDSAARYGIDPDTAVRVAMSEGGLSEGARPGDSGSSFGPFQLHYGDVASGGNAVSGLGDAFTAATGLDARDPNNAAAAIDYALSNVAKSGWGPFHGAARVGIGPMDGIGGRPSNLAPTPSDALTNPLGSGPAARTSQFGLGLSAQAAYAACGPAAAIAFANTYGRFPTPSEAMQLASSVGWTADSGMAGVSSEQQLLGKMGIPTKLESTVDWNHVAADAANGNPVILDTPGHYFYVSGVRQGQNGLEFNVGTSGTDLRQGSQWMSAAQIGGVGMGAVRAALYADNPTSATPSVAAPAQPSTPGPAQQASQWMTKANLVAGVTPDETISNPFGDALRQAGDIAGGIGSAVGNAASSVGSAVQGALAPQPLTAAQQPTPSDSLTNPTLSTVPPADRSTVPSTPGATEGPISPGIPIVSGAGNLAANAINTVGDAVKSNIENDPSLPAVALRALTGGESSTAISRDLMAKYGTTIPDDRFTPDDRERAGNLVMLIGGMELGGGKEAVDALGNKIAPLEEQAAQMAGRTLEGGAGLLGLGRDAGAAGAVPEPPVNPFALHTEPAPGRVPLNDEDIATHVEDLASRYEANDARIQQLQDVIANKGKGEYSGNIVRPSWAIGWSDDALRALAKREGLNPNDPTWGSRAQDAAYQSGLKGTGTTPLTPPQARAEIARLAAENQQLLDATDLPEGAATLYRGAPQAATELPFDRPYTAPDDAGAAGANPRSASQNPATAPGSTGAAAPLRATEPGAVPAPAEATTPAVVSPAAVVERGAGGQPPLLPTTGLPPGPPPSPITPVLQRLDAMYAPAKVPNPASIPARLEAARQSIATNITRGFSDRQVDINHIQEAYGRSLGRPLNADEMAAELQRLSAGGSAMVDVQQGLRPALQAVGNDYNALRNYVTLRSNVQVADALGNDARHFSGGLTKADSQQGIAELQQTLGPDRFAKVQQAADQVTQFSNSLRQRLVDSGVLSTEQAAQMEAKYPDWVKTRILDYMRDPVGGQGAGTKIGLASNDVHAYTQAGTQLAREDPIASTVAYAHQVEQMARKNEAFTAFRQMDQQSAAPALRKVPQDYSPTANQTTMVGFEDGQKVKYVTDNKALGEAINGAGVMSTPGWTSAWSKIFRSLATSRNPAFLVGNAALDIPTATLRTAIREGGPQHVPGILADMANGYADAFQGILSSTYHGATADFLKAGGGQSGYFTGSEGAAAQSVAALRRSNVFQIQGKGDLLRLAKDLVTLKPIEALGERVELGPRVMAYQRALKRGENLTKAVIDGRTVTVDFSQGGTVTKYLNNFIPFFNVAAQGPVQVARAFRDNPKAFAATVGTVLGMPTLAAEAWNRSDPQRAADYKDIPDYIKNQGIVVMLPGEAPKDAQGNRKPLYALIKTREWSPFVSLARDAAARALGDDTKSWQNIALSAASGASPNNATSFGQAAAEPLSGIPAIPAAAQLAQNRDWFRNSTIVTQRNDDNASAASKTLAPIIQAAVDKLGINATVRPSALDFLIKDQGAGVGSAGLAAADMAAGTPRKDNSPQSLPVVGGLINRFVGSSTGQMFQNASDQPVSVPVEKALNAAGIPTPSIPTSIRVKNQLTGSLSPPMQLLQTERVDYQRLMSDRLDQRLAPMLADPNWSKRTIESQKKALDVQVQAARDYAESTVYGKMDPTDRQARMAAGRLASAPRPKP